MAYYQPEFQHETRPLVQQTPPQLRRVLAPPHPMLDADVAKVHPYALGTLELNTKLIGAKYKAKGKKHSSWIKFVSLVHTPGFLDTW